MSFYKTSLLLVFACLSNIRVVRCGIPAIFAFGDSILDTGNNNNLPSLSKCNFYPYGRDFVNHTPTGRFSNGRIPTDLIAEGLGIKNIVPAYRSPSLQPNDLRTGVSFASGGSGLDKLTSKITGVISIYDQIDDFKAYIAKLNGITGNQTKTQSIISNAVFLISLGNNDLGISFISGGRFEQYNIFSYTDLLITWIRSFLEELYGLGARKFAVMGTLPLGCLPAAIEMGGGVCIEAANEGAKLFNGKLSTELQNLKRSLGGSRFKYIDMYNPFLNLVKNPQRSGFTTGSRSCCCTVEAITPCTDASRYVFWDMAHPTQKSYEVVLAPILKQLRSNFA